MVEASTLPRWVGGLVAAFVVCGGAYGQGAPATDPSDQAVATVDSLTVTAPEQPKAEQLPGLVSKFVDSHGAPSPGSRAHQIARWHLPICPLTGGLDTEFNEFVSARVIDVANNVGARTSKDAKCDVNLLIIFTTRPQQLLDSIRKDHPEMLGFHYAAQVKRIATFNRPIQSWYLTATKDFLGDLQKDVEFQLPLSGQAGSRLTAKISSEFVGAVVVVDTNKIAGLRIGAVADHVAMLSLARPVPSKTCTELPSILNSLDEECRASLGVDALTVYDTAYLKALYALNSENFLWLQKGQIASRIVREAEKR